MARWRYSESYPVAEVFQTRVMLEGQLVGLSASFMSEDDLQRLDLETDNMERHWETGDLLANVEADLEFHLIIASACPNRMLVDLYHSVRDRLTATQIQPIPVTAPARMRDSIRRAQTYRRRASPTRCKVGGKGHGKPHTEYRPLRRGGITLIGSLAHPIAADVTP